jgi:predicted DNA binding protein
VWTDTGTTELTDNPFEELTEKHRDVLRHAFHEGYFERPREANATEIANRLGVCRQTFAQHLRAAERKVFGTWQASAHSEDGSDRRAPR